MILDESVQIGREKLLLLLAVPYERALSVTGKGLTHDEVEVIGLKVARSWTGDAISEFINQRLAALPEMELAYAISDGGSNILRALRLCGIDRVADCTHVMMNLIAKQFEGNSELSKLNCQHSQLRSRWLMTDKSCLVTNTIRYKDRILKLFRLVTWVERIDDYWIILSDEVRQQLHFIAPAREAISQLSEVKYLFECAARLLKIHGLSQHTQLAFWLQVRQYRETLSHPLSEPAEAFVKGIFTYFEQGISQACGSSRRLLCCSDVIESIFGRYKNKGGVAAISGDVLGIVLYKHILSPQQVREALTEVSYPMVQEWLKENTCPTRYAQMSAQRKRLKTAAV